MTRKERRFWEDWQRSMSPDEVIRQDNEQRVLDYLKRLGPARTSMVSQACGVGMGNVNKILTALAETGLVWKPKHGWWAHDDWDPPYVGWEP